MGEDYQKEKINKRELCQGIAPESRSPSRAYSEIQVISPDISNIVVIWYYEASDSGE